MNNPSIRRVELNADYVKNVSVQTHIVRLLEKLEKTNVHNK